MALRGGFRGSPGPQEGQFTFQWFLSLLCCCKEQDATLTSHSLMN